MRLVLVTTGILNAEARDPGRSTNRAERPGYLTVYDLDRLGPLARAVAAPTARSATIDVPCTGSSAAHRLGAEPRRHGRCVGGGHCEMARDRRSVDLRAECSARGAERTAFAEQLDGAIRRKHEHKDFLAYHNGMTVICDSFREERPDELIVQNPSIVNGAQSAIAFAAPRTRAN